MKNLFNKIKEYSKTVLIVILILAIIYLFINNNHNNKDYNKLINKYQKQINTLIAKQELSNNKISNLRIDMNNRNLIISSLKTKLKNGKIDTIYSLNKYNLSPYAKVQYTITITDSLQQILPEIKVIDYGFLIKPNISILCNGKVLIGDIGITFFHYKKFGADIGIGYNKNLYLNMGLNYIFWSNSLIKVGYMVDKNIHNYIYVGLGVNL